MHRSLRQMFFTLVIFCLALGLAGAQENWPQYLRNSSNNPVVPFAAAVTNITGGSQWQTGAQGLNTGAGIVIAGGTFISPHFEGAATFLDDTDDRVTLRGFAAATGGLYWETGPLDVGVSVSFGSGSTPTIDHAAQTVY